MATSNAPCTLTLEDGTHYDLSSLSSAKEDYTTTVGDRTFKLNVCRSVVSELWKVDNPDKVGGFVSREGGDFSLGQFNDTLLISESTNQPMMYMSLGSPCPVNPLTAASTAVRFVCSPNDFHAGQPVLVAALPPGNPQNHCQFFFEWHTHVACPTNPKNAELEREHYIAFFSILLIALLTWFFGHTLYNRFYLKRRGSEQFPFPSLSLSSIRSRIRLPSLPSYGKSDVPRPGGGWRRRSQSSRGYSHIRADEDDEEEGFAGRFSLDDDDEDEDQRDGPRGLSDQGVRDSVLGEERDAWAESDARGASASASAQNGVSHGGSGTGGGASSDVKGKGKDNSSRGLVDF